MPAMVSVDHHHRALLQLQLCYLIEHLSCDPIRPSDRSVVEPSQLPKYWSQAEAAVVGSQERREEYSEIVIMDWMRRREELGETLDETKDPRILPTMTSHSKLTKTLHHLFVSCKNNESYEIIVGRDHLNKSKWGHGAWNIANILRRNENFK